MTPFEEGAGDGLRYELPWSAALLLFVPAQISMLVGSLHDNFVESWGCVGLCFALSHVVGVCIAAHYHPFYCARHDPIPIVSTIGVSILTSAASFCVSGLCLLVLEVVVLGHPFRC
ncbi:MAG: hypothetical protein KDC95_11195 [Planctomycetes bacterium]|nr:hypothetical protein [Planctomycetota bacterium]